MNLEMSKEKINDIDYKIETNEILKHLIVFINLTQEFNQKGKVELVNHTLEFMKDFIKILNQNKDE
jgi:hypothetical protein